MATCNRVRGRDYLVTPITAATLDALIAASAAIEDDEPNGDLEPSLGTEDDRESDGLHDERLGGEASLGWAETGSQLHLTAGYAPSGDLESDGDCDAEPN